MQTPEKITIRFCETQGSFAGIMADDEQFGCEIILDAALDSEEMTRTIYILMDNYQSYRKQKGNKPN